MGAHRLSNPALQGLACCRGQWSLRKDSHIQLSPWGRRAWPLEAERPQFKPHLLTQGETMSHPLVWQEARRQAATRAREDPERLEPSYAVGGNARWGSAGERRCGRPRGAPQVRSHDRPESRKTRVYTRTVHGQRMPVAGPTWKRMATEPHDKTSLSHETGRRPTRAPTRMRLAVKDAGLKRQVRGLCPRQMSRRETPRATERSPVVPSGLGAGLQSDG